MLRLRIEPYVEASISESSGIVIWCSVSGRMIACAINCDLEFDKQIIQHKLRPKIKHFPVIQVIYNLIEDCTTSQVLCLDEWVLLIAFLAFIPEAKPYISQLTQKLLLSTFEVAVRWDYQYLISYSLTDKTWGEFNRFGFETTRSIEYWTWMSKLHTLPFLSIKGSIWGVIKDMESLKRAFPEILK